MTESRHDGLAGNGVAAGDLFVILLGASIPCILRPDPTIRGQYRLVGECTVAGIRHDEASRDPDCESKLEL